MVAISSPKMAVSVDGNIHATRTQGGLLQKKDIRNSS